MLLELAVARRPVMARRPELREERRRGRCRVRGGRSSAARVEGHGLMRYTLESRLVSRKSDVKMASLVLTFEHLFQLDAYPLFANFGQ